MLRRSQAQRLLPIAAILAVYLGVAAIYTRPLIELPSTEIAGDNGDGALNAATLWWNATTLPLTERWWNPPYFYLTHDVTTFTENLLGVSPIATPIYWLTGNGLTTYNLSVFLTWPLSAFTMFLLARFLTGRVDVSFVAGLAYGFTPYRMANSGQLQMLACYWMPLALLGLHGYLTERKVRWLVLFGAAWLLQSLANGYLMVFGTVLIGLWLLYFCSTPASWRALRGIVTAWAISSLPLLPIMLRYRAVHDDYALRRSVTELLGLSVNPSGFVEAPRTVAFWGYLLPDRDVCLFPGLTILVLVVIGASTGISRWWPNRSKVKVLTSPRLRAGLAILAAISLAMILRVFFIGPLTLSVGNVVLFRMSSYNRVALLGIVAIGAWLYLTVPRKTWARRNPFVFYSVAALVIAVLAIGPVISVGSRLINPAPYRALMLYFPGFMEIRTPRRIWMLGVLCLCTAAGLAAANLSVFRDRLKTAALSVAVAGILIDGWLTHFPLPPAPPLWPVVEPRAADSAPRQPLIELPLGPDWDAAATFRSMAHRRPVVNGVSGYDPPHYAPLQEGLNGHDPEMLQALASFGSIDVVVNGDDDRDGAWARYVTSLPGVVQIAGDGRRTAYRIPAFNWKDDPLGTRLPIVAVQTSNSLENPLNVFDGKIETEWKDLPQRPGQWVQADLGAVKEVGGVSQTLGEFARDFPRELAIDLSVDGVTWDEVWQGACVARTFRAAVQSPREAPLHFTFPARPARFVRLRQLGQHRNYWRIAELSIHAPAPAQGGAARMK